MFSFAGNFDHVAAALAEKLSMVICRDPAITALVKIGGFRPNPVEPGHCPALQVSKSCTSVDLPAPFGANNANPILAADQRLRCEISWRRGSALRDPPGTVTL